MHRQTKVSLIVPAYNAAPTLHDCLDSLLAQTQPGLEIIVVDDGSDDDTPKILEDYATRFPVIRVLRQHNRGVSVARNAGLAIARGEFVAFVDSDDRASPAQYAELVARAQSDILDIAICNAWAHGLDGSRSKVFPEGIDGTPIAGQSWLVRAVTSHYLRHYIWCHLYRREFLCRHQLQFAPGITHQDIVWTNEVLIAAERVGYVDKPLYHYLQRAGSLSKPQSADGRLSAARHYIRVAWLLDGIARRCNTGTPTRIATQRQVVDEGIAVFHLARHLPPSHRNMLYRELCETDFVALLLRDAVDIEQSRRVWRRTMRYRLWYAANRLRALLSDPAGNLSHGEISGEVGGE